jgi:hypothetical protein
MKFCNDIHIILLILILSKTQLVARGFSSKIKPFGGLAKITSASARIGEVHEVVVICTLRATKDGQDDGKNVDDYVLNVHGGKYRFDDPSAVGTAIGRDFAESLYSSSTSSATEAEELAAASKFEAWPNWAKRMSSVTSLPSSAEEVKVLAVGQEVSVRIKNDYRTWEPYYAKIISLTQNVSEVKEHQCPFEIVSKVHGKLAPAGGASNLCDENDPYSDFKDVIVRSVPDTQFSQGHNWCLAVGTEETKWYYRLELESPST